MTEAGVTAAAASPAQDAIERLDEMIRVLRAQNEEPMVHDIPSLMSWAERRTACHARLTALEQVVLGLIQDSAGTASEPLAALERSQPDDVNTIRVRLAVIRDLVAALAEKDRRRSAFLLRARALVRAYVGSVAPAPQAYGRRGVPTGSDPLSSRSTSG